LLKDKEKEKGGEKEQENPHRARLVEFYTNYAPDKLSGVNTALEKFKGKEDQMFQVLEKKYAAQIKEKKEKEERANEKETEKEPEKEKR